MIRKYYGFNNYKIRKETGKSIIERKSKIYYLYEIVDIDAVIKQYEISINLKNYYKFVPNIYNSIINEYKNHYYVLLEYTNNILEIKNIFFEKKKIPSWKSLWIKKSDYIQDYYKKIKGKYKLIDESFDYYIGLLELAIYYLKDYGNYFDKLYIEHEIVDEENYYNPLNIKLDIKERDFAEYLKFLFYSSQYKKSNLHKLLLEFKNTYDYNLVISRLIYPSYYFNLFDDIILGKKEEELKSVICRNKEYEEYINQILVEIKNINLG